MPETPGLVSVVIPFANSIRFLSEAIESVLVQTYPQWELLLVDDGSADGSGELALEYAEKLPNKIHYLTHPGKANCGVTRSRNLGARHGNGEFFAFLDSDDVWLPHKLQLQVGFMHENPEAGLIYGPSEYWYDWLEDRTDRQPNVMQPVAPGDRLFAPPYLLINSYPFGRYGAPCPTSFLIRRHAFQRVGGFPEEFNPATYELCEDIAFLSKLYFQFPVFVSARCLDRYRCHTDSIWHRIVGTEREESELRFYYRWLRRYMKDAGIANSDVWIAVRRRAWMYWLPLPNTVTSLLRRAANRLQRRTNTSK